MVKGQITGSLIGNSLLGLGLAIVVGSWGRERQNFKTERAGLLSSLLILATIGLLVPAVFGYTEQSVRGAERVSQLKEWLSLSVAVILVHRQPDLHARHAPRGLYFRADGGEKREGAVAHLDFPPRPPGRDDPDCVGIGACLRRPRPDRNTAGSEPVFPRRRCPAVIGNAAEYVAAIYFARRDRMGLVMSIAVGSGIQVALLVAPLLVIVSYFMGAPMNLVFENPLELIAIAGVTFAVNAIAADGETTWFEGVLLLASYLILAVAFFFIQS